MISLKTVKNKCGNKKNKRKWQIEPLIVSAPISNQKLAGVFESAMTQGKVLERDKLFLNTTTNFIFLDVTITRAVTVPPLPPINSIEPPEMNPDKVHKHEPFSLDVDMIELSYGDFIMKKFIYKGRRILDF